MGKKSSRFDYDFQLHFLCLEENPSDQVTVVISTELLGKIQTLARESNKSEALVSLVVLQKMAEKLLQDGGAVSGVEYEFINQ